MFTVNFIVFHLAIMLIIQRGVGLVELPRAADNDILRTEVAIRKITNKLFTLLKLKGVKQNPKLKQYSLIHNYFVSLTLQDYNGLKQINRLSRVDKHIFDNVTANFIVLINEILNEGNSIPKEENTMVSDKINKDLVDYLDIRLLKIAYLKNKYASESPRVGINKGILRVFESRYTEGNTTTSHEDDSTSTSEGNENNVIEESEFWVPDNRRIYKGKKTKIKRFPFMASVNIFNQFQCGGSIIGRNLVITAASCLQLAWNNRLYRENPAFLSVRVGSNFYNGGGENIPVLEVYFYPTYNPKNLRNNLAVMRLLRRLKWRHKKMSRVKTISLDQRASALPYTVDGITVVGWGAKTQSNKLKDPFVNRISYDVLHVYPLEECMEIYSKEYVTRKHFCAGFMSRGGGACNRDVGGPGIVDGVLTGVISFGSPVCGTPDAPTVFTKVGYYFDWIEEIMDQETPTIRKRTTLKTTLKFLKPFLESTTLTPFTVSPVDYETLDQETEPTDTEKPPARMPPEIGEQDTGTFKDFLKTMFNSKEIDDYLDLQDIKPHDFKAQDNLINLIQQRQEQLRMNQAQQYPMITTTRTTPQATMERLHLPASLPEPLSTQSLDSPHVKLKTNTIKQAKKKTVIKKHKANHSPEEEAEYKSKFTDEAKRELEHDIRKLIESTDLKEIINLSNEPVKPKQQNVEEVHNNETLLLLYVSDKETSDGGIKIFDKEEDGLDVEMELSKEIDQSTGELFIADDDGRINEVEVDKDDSEKEKGMDIASNFDDLTYRQMLRDKLITGEGIQVNRQFTGDNSETSLSFNGENDTALSSILSKQILYDILSEVMGTEANKTVGIQ